MDHAQQTGTIRGMQALLAPAAFRALTESAFDLLAVAALDTLAFRAIDARGLAALRLPPDAVENGLAVQNIVGGEALTVLLCHMLPSVAANTPWKGEVDLLRADGTRWPAQVFAAPVPRADGAPDALILGAVDRTDLAETLAKLHYEQMLLRALLDHAPDAIYFKDLEGRLLRVSAFIAKVQGCTRDDLVGKTDADLYSPEFAAQTREVEQGIAATGMPIVGLEEKHVKADGEVVWVSTTKMPLRNEFGRIIGTFGITRDITQIKLAEEQRRGAESQLELNRKMESIGRLAAGIAHEVNTPTQFINDNTCFLADAFKQIARMAGCWRGFAAAFAGKPEFAEALQTLASAEQETEIDYLLTEIPRTLDQTSEGIARIAKIVRSLKEFSHPSAPDKRPSDLNHAIETAIAVSRHEWKYVAEVVTDFDPDLPSVPCMLDEFNQVMLNLVVNAAHAIGDVVKDSGAKGTITVRTRADGDWAQVDVQDTGTGIPPEVRKRLFEPFFTTKAIGKGTGQGLTIVRSVIVDKHGGTVDLTTEVGKGTTFHIRLPVHPPPPAAADATKETP
jgi:PAS domain S-box-containing protein